MMRDEVAEADVAAVVSANGAKCLLTSLKSWYLTTPVFDHSGI